MYAVVATGGKQYRVEAGSELLVERVAADAGSSITFDRVLLIGDGDSVTVGTPTVDGASVRRDRSWSSSSSSRRSSTVGTPAIGST